MVSKLTTRSNASSSNGSAAHVGRLGIDAVAVAHVVDRGLVDVHAAVTASAPAAAIMAEP